MKPVTFDAIPVISFCALESVLLISPVIVEGSAAKTIVGCATAKNNVNETSKATIIFNTFVINIPPFII